jgi:hypothetical protein
MFKCAGFFFWKKNTLKSQNFSVFFLLSFFGKKNSQSLKEKNTKKIKFP